MHRKVVHATNESRETKAIALQWSAIGREIEKTAEWETGVARINAIMKSRRL
jgi:hypothetical protein